MIRESLEVLGFAAVCLAAEKLTGSQTIRRVGRATAIFGGAYLAASTVDALKPSSTGPGRGIRNIVGGWFTDPAQPKVAQSQ
jgi:hypothetical protein